MNDDLLEKPRLHRPKDTKRIEVLVTADRKSQLEAYCERNNTTATKLINTALAKVLSQHRQQRDV